MEDYRIVNLHNNMLKVYRDGRVEREFIYTSGVKIWIKIGALSKTIGYYTFVLIRKKYRKLYLVHRVMGYAYLGLDIDDKTQIIDHIDRNRTNNNLINLRIVTQQQNAFNKSNIKGYYWEKERNKYRAQITVNRKKIHLGSYKTEICARLAYLTAKNHYHKY